MSSTLLRSAVLGLLCFTLACAKPSPDGDKENAIQPVTDPAAETSPTSATIVQVETKSTGSIEDRQKLIQHLLSDYDARNYPTNFSAGFSIALQKFDVIPDEDKVVADVWLRESWKDPRLAFNPEEYGGITTLRLPIQSIWRPDIMLYNTADGPNGLQCVETNAVVLQDGTVLWIPPCSLTANCDLTLDTAPYDEQTCKLKFGSWTFDGYSMDLQIYTSSMGELEYYEVNPRWEITDLAASRVTKTYACCVEPYLTVDYDLSFRRRRT